MNQEEKLSIMQAANEAKLSTYSPYSKFAVGAAIKVKDGTIIKGANIENAAYGLCICAERVAMFSMHMQGYKGSDVVGMAVTGNTEGPISPCGSCRQVMVELLTLDTPILLTNDKLALKETTVKELLPYSFEDFE